MHPSSKKSPYFLSYNCLSFLSWAKDEGCPRVCPLLLWCSTRTFYLCRTLTNQIIEPKKGRDRPWGPSIPPFIGEVPEAQQGDSCLPRLCKTHIWPPCPAPLPFLPEVFHTVHPSLYSSLDPRLTWFVSTWLPEYVSEMSCALRDFRTSLILIILLSLKCN